VGLLGEKNRSELCRPVEGRGEKKKERKGTEKGTWTKVRRLTMRIIVLLSIFERKKGRGKKKEGEGQLGRLWKRSLFFSNYAPRQKKGKNDGKHFKARKTMTFPSSVRARMRGKKGRGGRRSRVVGPIYTFFSHPREKKDHLLMMKRERWKKGKKRGGKKKKG